MKIPGTYPPEQVKLAFSENIFKMHDLIHSYRACAFKIIGIPAERGGLYTAEEVLQREELEIAIKHFKFLQKYGIR